MFFTPLLSPPHQSPLGYIEPFSSMEGNSHLLAYIHTSDFCTFPPHSEKQSWQIEYILIYNSLNHFTNWNVWLINSIKIIYLQKAFKWFFIWLITTAVWIYITAISCIYFNFNLINVWLLVFAGSSVLPSNAGRFPWSVSS